MIAPEYRIRLFLSVDLVGSTAFKAGPGRHTAEDQTYPIWVNLTNQFYRRFPAMVLAAFRELRRSEDASFDRYQAPVLWKTIGDEIVLCCRVENVNHLAFCVIAFIRAMDRYSGDLRAGGHDLDVKGTGWIAAFPAPNFTVFGSHVDVDQSELIDEPSERSADVDPHEHDFLGSEIDSGFRISHFSASDKLVISVGLALLLCNAAYHRLFNFPFNYEGRYSLKGVIDGHPYPIVSIDTERDTKKREVRNYENAVTNRRDVYPLHLANFLRSFMEDENLEVPLLCEQSEAVADRNLPLSYRVFIEKWTATAEEITRRRDSEAQSAGQEGTSAENRSTVEANLDLMVPEKRPSGPAAEPGG
jgi:hypothetical protein